MPLLTKYLPDVLLCGGALLVSFGTWLAWPPAGFVVAGALAIVAGMKLAAA